MQAQDAGPEAVTALDAAVVTPRMAGLQVEFGGDVVESNRGEHGPELRARRARQSPWSSCSFAFGSVIAMGLPLLSAVFGLGIGLSLIALLTTVMNLNSPGPILATMIGLGVGIDYALFVVTRHRQFLHEGMTVPEAAGRANATAGSAVVFAGITVVIAILGLQIAGHPRRDVDGHRVSDHRRGDGARRRDPAARAARHRRSSDRQPPRPRACNPWPRARPRTRSARVGPARFRGVRGTWRGDRRARPHRARHPAVQPATGLDRRGDRLDRRSTTRRSYDLLAEGFGPGFNGPLTIVVDLERRRARRSLTDLERGRRCRPGIDAVGPAVTNPQGDTAVLTAFPDSKPQDAATTELVHRLRGEVIPSVIGRDGGPRTSPVRRRRSSTCPTRSPRACRGSSRRSSVSASCCS